MLHPSQVRPALPAEHDRRKVQEQLQAKRDQLVQNYVREQRGLYAEMLPEVVPHESLLILHESTPPASTEEHAHNKPLHLRPC